MPDLDEIVEAWVHAERCLDATAMTGLLDIDFRGIEVGRTSAVALAVGVQTPTASFRGHRSDGRLRLTPTLCRRAAEWTALQARGSGPLPDPTTTGGRP